MTIKVNLNDQVSVKLTREGINRYYQFHEDLGIISDGPGIDESGWYKDQLWSIMMIFGPVIYLGGPNMFATEILLHPDPIAAVSETVK
jgi:hypothetical protein